MSDPRVERPMAEEYEFEHEGRFYRLHADGTHEGRLRTSKAWVGGLGARRIDAAVRAELLKVVAERDAALARLALPTSAVELIAQRWEDRAEDAEERAAAAVKAHSDCHAVLEKISLALGCLPSAFHDGDDYDHVLAKARELETEQGVMQDDLAAILRALGISDHARPASPHQVLTDEVLPAIERLRALTGKQAAVLKAEETFWTESHPGPHCPTCGGVHDGDQQLHTDDCEREACLLDASGQRALAELEELRAKVRELEERHASD